MADRDIVIIGGCIVVAVIARLLQVTFSYPPRGAHSYRATPWLLGFAVVLLVLARAIPKWLPTVETALLRLGWVRELSPIWGYRFLALGLNAWAMWIIVGGGIAALFYFFVWREMP